MPGPIGGAGGGLGAFAGLLSDAWSATSRALRVQVGASFPWLVARGMIPGVSLVHKFGRNPDVDNDSSFFAVWNGPKGSYTGFDATAGEAITVSSGEAADAGTVQSSGTLTGGSATTLVDSGADFVADSVAVGDCVINDSAGAHGIVTVVTATTLTVHGWRGSAPTVGDSYRVATTASTGAAVVQMPRVLDSAFALATVYVVLDGTTGVDTVGTDYLRSSRGRVVLAGSGGENAGDITAKQKTTTANVLFKLPAGYNSTMVACDTLPAGVTGYLLDWGLAIIGRDAADIIARLAMRPRGEAFQVQEEIACRATGSSFASRVYQWPKNGIPACADIRVEVSSDVNNAAAAAWFTLLLVED